MIQVFQPWGSTSALQRRQSIRTYRFNIGPLFEEKFDYRMRTICNGTEKCRAATCVLPFQVNRLDMTA